MGWTQKNKNKDGCFTLEDWETIYREFRHSDIKHADEIYVSDLNNAGRHFGITGGDVIKEYVPIETESPLPSGIYLSVVDHSGIKLHPWTFPKDELILFELDEVKEILQDSKEFQTQRDIYTKLGIAYKRGVLLYGPPGTGKTTSINMILRKYQHDDVLIFYIRGELNLEFVKSLKNDKRLKIFIFEELTETLKETGLNEILSFLDGELSLDNSYTIATTNYPEKLPGNLVGRPGRFDKLFKINCVSEKDRKIYLEFFLKRTITPEELLLTKNYSMAFLKELLLIVLKQPVLTLKEGISMLNKHLETAKSNFKESPGDDKLHDHIL